MIKHELKHQEAYFAFITLIVIISVYLSIEEVHLPPVN